MRVLLVDDHRLLLEGLVNLLTAHGVEVVGMAKDGNEALEIALATRPDVILMDIRMPNCNGLEATRNILLQIPEMRIVILTTSLEDDDLFESVKSGAFGYLLKSMDAEELVEALYQVVKGIPPFSSGLATRLLKEFSRLSPPLNPAQVTAATHFPSSNIALSSREKQVLELVSRGLTYKEAGAVMNLSPRTIKYHMANVMERLHMQNRAQLLAYAGKMGLGGDDNKSDRKI